MTAHVGTDCYRDIGTLRRGGSSCDTHRGKQFVEREYSRCLV